MLSLCRAILGQAVRCGFCPEELKAIMEPYPVLPPKSFPREPEEFPVDCES